MGGIPSRIKHRGLLFSISLVILVLFRADSDGVAKREISMKVGRQIPPSAIDPTLVGLHEKNASYILIPSSPDPVCASKVFEAIKGIVPRNETPLATCPVTSQVRIIMGSSWILQSLDENGKPKTVGGDEYYIVYYDKLEETLDPFNRTTATAVAKYIDQNDGTYRLEFVTTPLNPHPKKSSGYLYVHLEYSCGIGRLGQPRKNSWNSGGFVHTDYKVFNVSAPPMQTFELPARHVDLCAFETIYVLGDSVMGNFVGRGEGCMGKANLKTGSNPSKALHTKTVADWLEHLRRDHPNLQMNTTNAAILTGSSTWDLLRNDVDQWETWEDHQEAIQTLIFSIRRDFPNVEILWKSATALHICNFNVEEVAKTSQSWGVDRVRYMSESRSRQIDIVQKRLLQKLNVPVLDVYEATYLSADRSRNPTDARHYNFELNRLMLNWFYQCTGKSSGSHR